MSVNAPGLGLDRTHQLMEHEKFIQPRVCEFRAKRSYL